MAVSGIGVGRSGIERDQVQNFRIGKILGKAGHIVYQILRLRASGANEYTFPRFDFPESIFNGADSAFVNFLESWYFPFHGADLILSALSSLFSHDEGTMFPICHERSYFPLTAWKYSK